MNKPNLWNIVSLVFWLLLAAAELLLGYQIFRLNMLPNHLLVLACCGLGIVAVLIALLLLPGRKQKLHVRQIIGCLLCLIVMAGCSVGAYAISRVNTTISAVTTVPTVTAVMEVYVLKDDAAQSIDDIRDYTVGITETQDAENVRKTLADLESQLGQGIATVSYETIPEMINGLFAGEVNALILNSVYVDIISDMEGYTDFPDRIRIVHEHTVIEEVVQEIQPDSPVNTQPGETAPEAEEEVDDTAFIVYLSGSDTRNYFLSRSRSDVNILAVVNTETKQILLVNTPRDYYVSSPASKTGAMDKLTHCGIYGPECSMKALENLYDISIRHYAQINFTGFETLIDAIGGVDVYCEYGSDALLLNRGYNHMNGSQALAFARDRYHVAGGDNGRGKNQMRIITAVIQKLCSGTTIISNYSNILSSLEGMFTTSMTREEISALVKMQLTDMATWNIQSVAATGNGGTDSTFASGGLYAYVMYPHKNVVDQISVLIDRVLADEILTSEDVALQN